MPGHYWDGWTADDWVRDLTRDRPAGTFTFISASITRGPRRDLALIKYLNEQGEPASIEIRVWHRKRKPGP